MLQFNFKKIKLIAKFSFISLVLLTAACSHHIQINPETEKLRSAEGISKSSKNVGYYISPQNKLKEVKTPGGGGDSVTYEPYQDAEGALNTTLSKIYNRAYSVDSLENKNYFSDKNIEIIFIPTITTNSSSSSALTWPPTEFTVNLSCKAINPDGDTVWEKEINAKGNAKFSEFKKDFGLSGRRAMEDAFMQLLQDISKSDDIL